VKLFSTINLQMNTTYSLLPHKVKPVFSLMETVTGISGLNDSVPVYIHLHCIHRPINISAAILKYRNKITVRCSCASGKLHVFRTIFPGLGEEIDILCDDCIVVCYMASALYTVCFMCLRYAIGVTIYNNLEMQC